MRVQGGRREGGLSFAIIAACIMTTAVVVSVDGPHMTLPAVFRPDSELEAAARPPAAESARPDTSRRPPTRKPWQATEGEQPQKTVVEAQTLALAAAKWRLGRSPLTAPSDATVPRSPVTTTAIPVIRRIPTQDRVVFLTVDDGAEKDPAFMDMVRDLNIPFTAFISDYVSRDNYSYFRELSRLGNGVENHTVNHPELTRLAADGQRSQICNQQNILEKEIGRRPSLFRPPYGAYNDATLSAAKACGSKAAVLWTVEAFPDRLEYSGDLKLHPGDIILTHFRGPEQWRGSMTDMLRRVVNEATAQGFAFGRLDAYLQRMHPTSPAA
ncbi:polysaccharide deacetylase family protein [Streptomyces sp. NPDC059985]|uniref:polysaccharide deacetylase family protein n=1 Tax=Streptomyces sp. NPDC059985 TaxID=3347025 RepID=UPI0036910E7B